MGAGFALASASAERGRCSVVRGEVEEQRVASVLRRISVVGDTDVDTGWLSWGVEIRSDVI